MAYYDLIRAQLQDECAESVLCMFVIKHMMNDYPVSSINTTNSCTTKNVIASSSIQNSK